MSWARSITLRVLLPVMCIIALKAQAYAADSFNLISVHPNADRGTYFFVQESQGLPQWDWTLGVFTLYYNQLLNADLETIVRSRRQEEITKRHAGLNHLLFQYLYGGIGLTDRISLMLDMPFFWYYKLGVIASGAVDEEWYRLSPGDIRLFGKATLLDLDRYPVGLAFIPSVSFPTGEDDHFLGDDGVTAEMAFVAEVRPIDDLSIAFNTSFQTRKKVVLNDISFRDFIKFSLGANYRLPHNLSLIAEVETQTAANNAFGSKKTTPAEARFGVRWRPEGENWMLGAGGSAGIIYGRGMPRFAGFINFGYSSFTPEPRPKPEPKPEVPVKEVPVEEAPPPPPPVEEVPVVEAPVEEAPPPPVEEAPPPPIVEVPLPPPREVPVVEVPVKEVEAPPPPPVEEVPPPPPPVVEAPPPPVREVPVMEVPVKEVEAPPPPPVEEVPPPPPPVVEAPPPPPIEVEEVPPPPPAREVPVVEVPVKEVAPPPPVREVTVVEVPAEELPVVEELPPPKVIREVIEVEAPEEAICIYVTEYKIYFAFDSSRLDAQARAVIGEVIEFIAGQKDTAVIELRGWTDPIGTVAYNKGLALRRARAAADYIRHMAQMGNIKVLVIALGIGIDYLSPYREGRRADIVVKGFMDDVPFGCRLSANCPLIPLHFSSTCWSRFLHAKCPVISRHSRKSHKSVR